MTLRVSVRTVVRKDGGQNLLLTRSQVIPRPIKVWDAQSILLRLSHRPLLACGTWRDPQGTLDLCAAFPGWNVVIFSGLYQSIITIGQNQPGQRDTWLQFGRCLLIHSIITTIYWGHALDQALERNGEQVGPISALTVLWNFLTSSHWILPCNPRGKLRLREVNDLLKVIWLVSGRTKNRTYVCLSPQFVSFSM